jgi:hypothetical protein
MRTVTFSDREIAAWVNEHFVATWTNRRPKFHNCEMETEQYIVTHKGEIFATRNIVTFVADGDGRVLHYFSGFYAPDHFARELRFGWDIFDTKSVARRAELHDLRIAELKKEEKELRAARPLVAGLKAKCEAAASLFPCGGRVRNDDRFDDCGPPPETAWRGDENLASVWRSRRDYQVSGLQHLQRVHRWIAGKAKQRGEMPAIERLLTGHDSSDPFAEE